MELTPRLKKIADLVPSGTQTLADIGTDHAYLPIYCILNGICKNAVAMDINQGPLKRALESTKKYQLEKSISLRLSDGIKELKNGEADVIAIAGMGGLLIKKILEEGRPALTTGTKLLLQPMIAQKEIRQYLYNNGYTIENEYVMSEGNKFYNILEVTFGNETKFDDEDLIIGRNLKENSPEQFQKYVQYKIGVLSKILEGMEKSLSYNDAESVKKELKIFENVLRRSIGDEG